MNFLNFEYFLAIRKAGTLRGAAEVLYISPQALSEHLGKLEKELGTPLFHRTKPLTLTPAGERFGVCAETCLAAKKELETELASLLRQNEDQLSLGVPAGMPPPLLLPFLSYFRHAHPAMTVTVAELPTQTGAIRDLPRHIDAVFCECRDEGERLRYESVLTSRRFVVALRRELLYTALPRAAAEAVERSARADQALALTAFRGCPFILKRMGSIVRQNEDGMFRAAGFAPTGSMETGDMEMTVRMVLLGEAAVIFPEPVARASLVIPAAFERDPAVLLCPVDVGDETWSLSIGWDRYRRVPGGAAVLTEAARSYYENMLGSADGQERR